jgi:hypothetical protein
MNVNTTASADPMRVVQSEEKFERAADDPPLTCQQRASPIADENF